MNHEREQDEYHAYLSHLLEGIDRRRRMPYSGPLRELKRWQRALLLVAWLACMYGIVRAFAVIS